MPDFPDVMAHGPIETVAHDVFWGQGSIALAPGLRITRNMVIVRADGERTLLHSVRLSPEGEATLASLDFSHIASAHGSPLMNTAKQDLRATIEATFA